MIVKTKGIVFHQIKYAESSIIAKIYTLDYGLQSFIVKGARSKKSKISPALFQPLSLVEIVAYRKVKSSLHHLKEIKSIHQFASIPFDITKSSICIFLNELLYRSIKEEESNASLFDYIFNAVQWLDLSNDQFYNFHLVFAIELTKHLGFYPQGSYSKQKPLLNLVEGQFESRLNMIHEHLGEEHAKLFSALMQCSFENMYKIKLNGDLRTHLAEKIAIYYQHHLANFEQLKSLEVLKTVLS